MASAFWASFLPVLDVFIGHFLKVVDIVEVDILNITDFGFDVSRVSNIDEEDRFLFSILHRPWRLLVMTQEILGRIGSADDDVRPSSALVASLQRESVLP